MLGGDESWREWKFPACAKHGRAAGGGIVVGLLVVVVVDGLRRTWIINQTAKYNSTP